MRKPESIQAKTRACALLLAACAVLAPAGAHELKDVSLNSASGQAFLSLSFSPGASEGEYPLYFQKADASKGSVLISFLETETSFPLGRHALDGDSPEIEEILLKKITSPSGKSFLGVEIKLRRPPAGDFPIDAAPKNILKVRLGDGGNRKYAWSLAKSLQAADAYLSAKAESPPAVKEAARQSAAVAEEFRKAAPAPAPAPIAAKSPAASIPAVSDAAGRAKLTEVKLASSSAGEDLMLAFDPPSAPAYVPGSGGKDSSWLELTFENTGSGLSRKEYALPASPVFKRMTIAEKKTGLLVRIQLSTREPVRILPHATGLVLSGPGRGEPGKAFTWTSARPDVVPASAASAPAETFPSAHEAGLALESRKASQGLSSGKIFSLAGGGKTMVLLRDSVSLRTRPGADGGTIRKIPIGERLARIESRGEHQRVVSGADTGYIRSVDLVYEDELTEAQDKAMRARIEAKEAKIAAAAAREEEKARKAEAAIAAAEEAARKKAELAAAAAAAAAEKQALLASQAATAAASAAAKAAAPAIETQNPNAGPGTGAHGGPKLAIADNPELAAKLAQEKLAAEEEKKRIEPESNRIAYNSYGRRDPFIPVEQGGADNGIDIDQMKVVGIIWQSEQPMAILEHNREAGISFTIKEGDPVHNGRVARISRDGVAFDISEYGISRSYSLKLVSSKEGTKR